MTPLLRLIIVGVFFASSSELLTDDASLIKITHTNIMETDSTSVNTSEITFNKPISELVAEGFTLCYEATYGTPVTSANLLEACNAIPNRNLFVGSKKSTSARDISLGAYGLAQNVFTETSTITTAQLHDGVYWYFYPGKSFGFADSEEIFLNSADTKSGSSRLSWYMDQAYGGFRSGDTLQLNNDNNWWKVIYAYSGPMPTMAPTVSAEPTVSSAPTVDTAHYGVHYDKPVSELVAEGFEPCYFEPYSAATTEAVKYDCGINPAPRVFVGSMSSASADTVSLGAYGIASVVFNRTYSTDIGYLHNGVYWYMYPGKSFGFSDNKWIQLESADTAYGAGRLSWSITGIHGGYRSGNTMSLNWDRTWYKVIYVHPNSQPGYPTLSPATALPSVQPTINTQKSSFPVICPFYSTENTASATQNYATCDFTLCNGEIASVSGAGACTGDQYLRLVNSKGTQLASNDQSGGYQCSRIRYKSKAKYGTCEVLTVWEGCYGMSACTGVVTISDGTTAWPTRNPAGYPGRQPMTPTYRPTFQPTVVEATVVFSSLLTLSGGISSEVLTNTDLAVVEQAVADSMLLEDYTQVHVTEHWTEAADTGGLELSETLMTTLPNQTQSTYDYIIELLTTVDTADFIGHSGDGQGLYSMLRDRLEQTVMNGSFPVVLAAATTAVAERLQMKVTTNFTTLAAAVTVGEPVITPYTSSNTSEESNGSGSGKLSSLTAVNIATIAAVGGMLVLSVVMYLLIRGSQRSDETVPGTGTATSGNGGSSGSVSDNTAGRTPSAVERGRGGGGIELMHTMSTANVHRGKDPSSKNASGQHYSRVSSAPVPSALTMVPPSPLPSAPPVTLSPSAPPPPPPPLPLQLAPPVAVPVAMERTPIYVTAEVVQIQTAQVVLHQADDQHRESRI